MQLPTRKLELTPDEGELLLFRLFVNLLEKGDRAMCFRPSEAVVMTNICKKCGADNEVGATECTQCGAKLRAMPPMPGVADAAALGSMANPSAPSAPGAPKPPAPKKPE